jgi:hypothetical protein
MLLLRKAANQPCHRLLLLQVLTARAQNSSDVSMKLQHERLLQGLMSQLAIYAVVLVLPPQVLTARAEKSSELSLKLRHERLVQELMSVSTIKAQAVSCPGCGMAISKIEVRHHSCPVGWVLGF